MVQESFCIGVSQKGCFKEGDCIAKTPLGCKVAKTMNSSTKLIVFTGNLCALR